MTEDAPADDAARRIREEQASLDLARRLQQQEGDAGLGTGRGRGKGRSGRGARSAGGPPLEVTPSACWSFEDAPR
jgi:hypothetical protein